MALNSERCHYFFLCCFQIRDMGQEPCGRLSFLKEPKTTKGVPPAAVCNLNITLPTHKKVMCPCLNILCFWVGPYHPHGNEAEYCPDIRGTEFHFVSSDGLLPVSFIRKCASSRSLQSDMTHACSMCLAHCVCIIVPIFDTETIFLSLFYCYCFYGCFCCFIDIT